MIKQMNPSKRILSNLDGDATKGALFDPFGTAGQHFGRGVVYYLSHIEGQLSKNRKCHRMQDYVGSVRCVLICVVNKWGGSMRNIISKFRVAAFDSNGAPLFRRVNFSTPRFPNVHKILHQLQQLRASSVERVSTAAICRVYMLIIVRIGTGCHHRSLLSGEYTTPPYRNDFTPTLPHGYRLS